MKDIPLKFDIADNCNPCCIGCCLKENSIIYINKNFEIEKFDFKKSKNHEADYLKTKNRIQEAIGNIMERIEYFSEIKIDEKEFLIMKDIRLINEAIDQISFEILKI